VQEKERAKDLIAAGKQCEAMAAELLALAAGADSAGRILTATDRRNVEFLDILIENEQKEVIAHTVVQRYLQVSSMLLNTNNGQAACCLFHLNWAGDTRNQFLLHTEFLRL
jgi:hypothetical protein